MKVQHASFPLPEGLKRLYACREFPTQPIDHEVFSALPSPDAMGITARTLQALKQAEEHSVELVRAEISSAQECSFIRDTYEDYRPRPPTAMQKRQIAWRAILEPTSLAPSDITTLHAISRCPDDTASPVWNGSLCHELCIVMMNNFAFHISHPRTNLDSTLQVPQRDRDRLQTRGEYYREVEEVLRLTGISPELVRLQTTQHQREAQPRLPVSIATIPAFLEMLNRGYTQAALWV